MALTLEAIEILDAIERRGSFAAAAAELGRVPSALTYSVRKLEDELDVLLFDRSGHRARLTTAGRTLLDEGRHLLRSARDLEQRVKREARGWEAELRIALSGLIAIEPLLALVERFYALQAAQQGGTQLRIGEEVLGGPWDALLTGRADLAIGLTRSADGSTGMDASGADLPRAGAGITSRQFGTLAWRFCVAPGHPLAALPEPLRLADVACHRAAAIGDTSRALRPLSAGLIAGQDVLTLPSMRAKLQAQIAGIGCGWLPEHVAQAALERGLLVERTVEAPRPPTPLHVAWPAAHKGKALKLWLALLAEPEVQAALLAPWSP